MYIKFSSRISDKKFNVNYKTVRLRSFIQLTDVYCENISKRLNILRGQSALF
jgi:hypothetical protein